MSNEPGGSLIQAVIDASDIISEVSKHVQLKPKNNEYTACCPFHQEDTPSFYVNPSKRLFYCFGCQAGGNVINFRAMISGLQFKDALGALAHELNITHTQNNKNKAQETLKTASKLYQSQLKSTPEAIRYLSDRGISQTSIEQFELGFTPDEWRTITNHSFIKKQDALDSGLIIQKESNTYDRFRNRITFPIRDHRGSLCGLGGRVINDDKPKYLNSPETELYHKGKILYGLNQAIRKNAKRIIVVEGYLDVITLHQAGFEGGVAALGTAFTTEHFDLICPYATDLIFCFDGDRAGHSAARKAFDVLLPKLRDQVACFFVFLNDGEDPDSIISQQGPEAFQDRLTQAMGFSDYLKKIATDDLNANNIEHQAQIIKNSAHLLKQMPDSIYSRLIKKDLQIKIPTNNTPKVPTHNDSTHKHIKRLIELICSNKKTLKDNQAALEKITHYLPPIIQNTIQTLNKHPETSLAEIYSMHNIQYLPSKCVTDSDSTAATTELSDLLSHFCNNYLSEQIKQLSHQAQHNSLTPTDQQKLLSLLQEKKHLKKIKIILALNANS